MSVRGDVVEIIADFESDRATAFGLKVRMSGDGERYIRIFYDTASCEFGVDGNVPDSPQPSGPMAVQGRGPSYLAEGQPVRLHIFVDKLVVEAFVNGQTCTVIGLDRDPASDGIDLFSEGASARCAQLEIWEMQPTWPSGRGS